MPYLMVVHTVLIVEIRLGAASYRETVVHSATGQMRVAPGLA